MKQKAGLAVMILLAVIMSTTIRERMPNPQDTFARPFEYSGNTAPGFGELGDVKAKLTDSVDGNRTTETFIEIQFGFTTSKYQRPPYATLVDGKNRDINPLRPPKCGSVQTGVPVTCTVGFEVARDATDNAVLRVHPGYSDSAAPVIVHPLTLEGGTNG
ncbi:hypothetical protein HW450_12220 [Corynebacterium hindlerae]|uniref:Uncharacterized protein n=1 Tax=Corynebacterium hindlerae TaxID=699041 RepID=A0A7G5FEN4_9CORY|nr:hypothetical protein [Corynebacterium hindlerae]QMV85075.1 hypothetical protein HW450_12220 [Corynebacterium hindlerae]